MFKNLNNKLFRALSLTIVLATLIAPMAFADNVVNDVTIGGNDTFTAPGSTTIGYKINTAAAGDPQSGCNTSDGSPATITLSVPAGVTASSTSLTFSACNAFQYVTFSSTTSGNYAINVSSISDAGTGSYKNEANFTLHVNAPPQPLDTTPPVIIPNVSGMLGDNGWNVSDVTVSWTVVDDESAISSTSGCDPTTIDSDTGGTTLTCTATSAGGTTSESITIKRDATAPTISGSASPAANGTGWNNTDVTVSFTCGDNLSGVASCGPNQTLSAEGAGQSVSGTAMDNAGNSASTTVSGINIDKTAPTVALVGGPADGENYYFGFVPAAPTCSASDALSGLDGSCSVSGYGTTVGLHTVIASASDLAGNTSSASATYEVLAWTLSGFYNPVDMGSNVWNTVKGGSTVPLKFEIFAGPAELTDVAYIKSFVATKVVCDNGGTEDPVDLTTTGGTSLRYDWTAGQFIQNWQTPKSAGICYKVTMTAQDLSTIIAYFKTK